MTGWNMPPGCNRSLVKLAKHPHYGPIQCDLVRSFAQVALFAETQRQREEEAALINAHDAKLDREALWADATHEPAAEPEEFDS